MDIASKAMFKSRLKCLLVRKRKIKYPNINLVSYNI